MKLGLILAAPLAMVALFMVLVIMTKGIWWVAVRVGLRRVLHDWRWWLMVATCYVAFQGVFVIAEFGPVIGWGLLVALIAVCFWSICKVAHELNVDRCDNDEW